MYRSSDKQGKGDAVSDGVMYHKTSVLVINEERLPTPGKWAIKKTTTDSFP
jgi:hypothetical protein